MKEILQRVIADQVGCILPPDNVVERSIPQRLIDHEDILVISGIRRSGKSTLLQQIRRSRQERDYYINFDDDRLVGFDVSHFQVLYELFIELFGVQKTFYFDEIQNIPEWERFVRRLHDQGCKVFVTGSNATMLSRELGTRLTGRYLGYELYPFSFQEFLKFEHGNLLQNNAQIKAQSSENRALLKSAFNAHFELGGFPGYLKTREPDTLKYLFENILYRDIMVRNNLTKRKPILWIMR